MQAANLVRTADASASSDDAARQDFEIRIVKAWDVMRKAYASLPRIYDETETASNHAKWQAATDYCRALAEEVKRLCNEYKDKYHKEFDPVKFRENLRKQVFFANLNWFDSYDPEHPEAEASLANKREFDRLWAEYQSYFGNELEPIVEYEQSLHRIAQAKQAMEILLDRVYPFLQKDAESRKTHPYYQDALKKLHAEIAWHRTHFNENLEETAPEASAASAGAAGGSVIPSISIPLSPKGETRYTPKSRIARTPMLHLSALDENALLAEIRKFDAKILACQIASPKNSTRADADYQEVLNENKRRKNLCVVELFKRFPAKAAEMGFAKPVEVISPRAERLAATHAAVVLSELGNLSPSGKEARIKVEEKQIAQLNSQLSHLIPPGAYNFGTNPEVSVVAEELKHAKLRLAFLTSASTSKETSGAESSGAAAPSPAP